MNKETLRMQMLAGLITESQYKQKLKRISLKENEGSLPQDIKVTKDDDDMVTIDSNSGEYVGFIENGKVSFSVVDDERDEFDGFDDYNWKDILGNDHAFVKIIDSIGGDVEALDDYVQITVDANKLLSGYDLNKKLDNGEIETLLKGFVDRNLPSFQNLDDSEVAEYPLNKFKNDTIEYLKNNTFRYKGIAVFYNDRANVIGVENI